MTMPAVADPHNGSPELSARIWLVDPLHLHVHVNMISIPRSSTQSTHGNCGVMGHHGSSLPLLLDLLSFVNVNVNVNNVLAFVTCRSCQACANG